VGIKPDDKLGPPEAVHLTGPDISLLITVSLVAKPRAECLDAYPALTSCTSLILTSGARGNRNGSHSIRDRQCRPQSPFRPPYSRIIQRSLTRVL
jgi:hypothetical protein